MHRIAAHLPDYDRFVTFCLGAAGYGLLEYLYRGRTHWTMLLAGGAALVLLRGLNRRMAGAPLVLRALAGALAGGVYEGFGVSALVVLWIAAAAVSIVLMRVSGRMSAAYWKNID